MPRLFNEKNPAWKGGLISRKCTHCGKEFKIYFYRKDIARFCSRFCANKVTLGGIKNKGIERSKDYREKISKSLLGKVGTMARNWQGGKSFELYTENWTDILKMAIRQRDKFTCGVCGKNGYDVHHKDYDKKNCDPKNLITLCRKCHIKTNFNRKYWIDFFNGKK